MKPLNTRFLTVLISLVFIGFTVCALAAKPFCGDGVCRKNETVNSCPLDCDSGGGGEPPSGNLEPVDIWAADAGTNSLSVHWLAPVGAARYEVRYSTVPFDFDDEGDFSDWGEYSDAFAAAEPGANEYFTVRGLAVDVVYHVGVRAIDADGNRSALTSMSFISDETKRTAQPNPDIWGVDTVGVGVEVPESAEGTSVVFDNGGSPVVAWFQKDPNEVRYAYQDGDGSWLFELVRQGENGWVEFGDNFGLAHQPEGFPGESFPAVIFRERTPRLKKKRGHSERGTYYGYRREANDWAIEEIVRGESRVNGGQGGAEESLEFIWDAALVNDLPKGWTPTVSYVVHPLWEDPETTAALVLAERDHLTGEWIKSQSIESDAPIGIYSTELRRGANGDLHVMMSMSDDDGDWVLVAHRDSIGEWNYARTDRTEGVYVETFAVDAQNRYYLAGTRRWQDINGQSQTDVVLLDDAALAIIIDPCDRPEDTLGVGEYEIVDTPGLDIFKNGEADGMLVDTLPDGRVYEVRLTVGPNQNPAVHLFANRRGSELVEARVFSRCDGPASGWIRDMVDRPHSINSRTVAVSETAMAWSFNLGQRYGSLQSDRLLIAQRVGNACSSP